MLEILKWKDFNENGYLQGVRHAAPYGDYFGFLWRPLWIRNGRQIQKSSDLGKIWSPSRSCSCELMIVIVFGIGRHGVGWCPPLLCNGNSSYYYYSYWSTFFFRINFFRHVSRKPYSGSFWNWTHKFVLLAFKFFKLAAISKWPPI